MDLSPFTSALDHLTARMDKAERRSMMALSGITEALGALASRIPSSQDYAEIQRAAMRAAERSDAFRRLSRRVDDVMARIQAVEASPEADVHAVRRLEDAITRLTGHIQERQDETAQSIATLGQTVQRLTQQLSALQNSEAAPVDELREQLYDFSETLALVKQKTDKMVLRDELTNFEGRFDGQFGKTLQASFDKALNEFTMRLEAAEGRSADAIQGIESDLSSTSERLLSLEEQLGAIADGASTQTSTQALAASGMLSAFDKRLSAIETHIRAERAGEIDDLRREFRELSNRIADLEQTARTAPQARQAMSAPIPHADERAAIDLRSRDEADERDEIYRAPDFGRNPAAEAGPGRGIVPSAAYDDDEDFEPEEDDEDFRQAAYAATRPSEEGGDPSSDFLDAARRAAQAANLAREAIREDRDDAPAFARTDSFADLRAARDEEDETSEPEGVEIGFETRPQAWRFAENYYNTNNEDERGTKRGRRSRKRTPAWRSGNRGFVMAATATVAVAVMIGVFVALQATQSRDLPENQPLSMPPADKSPVSPASSVAMPHAALPQDAAPTADAEPEPEPSTATGLASEPPPDEDNAIEKEASVFSSDDKSGLTALFNSAIGESADEGTDDSAADDSPDESAAPEEDEETASTEPAIEEPAPEPALAKPEPKLLASAPASTPRPVPATREPASAPETYGPMPTIAPAAQAPAAPAAPQKDLSGAKTQYKQALDLLRSSTDAVSNARAANLLKSAANDGLAVAQYRLGTLYQEGRGVSQDMARARSHYEVAAKAGNRSAMHNLAVLYAMDENFEQAATWFRRAAELGVTDSQFNLAVLYLRGQGVTKDEKEAFRWFSIAAAQGDTEAVSHRDQLSEVLGPQGAPISVAASRWTPAPADPVANGLFFDSEPSQEIVLVQTLLTDLGFDPGTPDGVMGPKTREAIRSFERSAGMPVSGTWSAQLVAQLRNAAANRTKVSSY